VSFNEKGSDLLKDRSLFTFEQSVFLLGFNIQIERIGYFANVVGINHPREC